MPYDKPKAIIDLEEYNDLLKRDLEHEATMAKDILARYIEKYGIPDSIEYHLRMIRIKMKTLEGGIINETVKAKNIRFDKY